MKDAHIVVRIEQGMLDQLQQIAKKEDRPVSWLIRRAIEGLIKESKRARKP